MAQLFNSFREAEAALREAVNVEPSRANHKTELVSDQDLPANYNDWLTSRDMAGYGDPAKFWEAMGL
jgi:hypothetical protein